MVTSTFMFKLGKVYECKNEINKVRNLEILKLININSK